MSARFPGPFVPAAAAIGLWLLVAGCQAAVRPAQDLPRSPLELGVDPDLPVAHAPFDELRANWKQRLEQPYVYLEARGTYTAVGRLLERAHRELLAAGREPMGPPFALYYDDPARTPLEDLRMRACFPVNFGRPKDELMGALRYDVLESTTVVYAFVSGPYPEVGRAYPGLFAFMNELGWVEAGPIRESYLVNPADVTSWDELITEVQIPARSP